MLRTHHSLNTTYTWRSFLISNSTWGENHLAWLWSKEIGVYLIFSPSWLVSFCKSCILFLSDPSSEYICLSCLCFFSIPVVGLVWECTSASSISLFIIFFHFFISLDIFPETIFVNLLDEITLELSLSSVVVFFLWESLLFPPFLYGCGGIFTYSFMAFQFILKLFLLMKSH